MQVREHLVDLAQFAGVVARQNDLLGHDKRCELTGLTGFTGLKSEENKAKDFTK
jgi:hypothetical protein